MDFQKLTSVCADFFLLLKMSTGRLKFNKILINIIIAFNSLSNSTKFLREIFIFELEEFESDLYKANVFIQFLFLINYYRRFSLIVINQRIRLYKVINLIFYLFILKMWILLQNNIFFLNICIESCDTWLFSISVFVEALYLIPLGAVFFPLNFFVP